MMGDYCWLSEQRSKPGHIFVVSYSIFLILLSLSITSGYQPVEAACGANTLRIEDKSSIGLRNGFSSFLELQGHDGRRGLLQMPSLENGSDSSATNNYRPLAVKGGRRDPFHSFHRYRGGYDIKSKHYWGSLAFSGIPGYALAVAWVLVGLLLALSLCCALCCCSRKQSLTDSVPTHPQSVYFWLALLLVTIFTALAIGSCAVVYVGTREFTEQARKIEDVLYHASDNATDSIHLVTAAIVKVENLLEPYGSIDGLNLQSLNSTKNSLDDGSRNIRHVIRKNTNILDKIIKYLEIIIIVCTSVALFLIILGPLCGLLGWKRFFYLVLTVGWILTVIISVLFGVNFALSNLVVDTCDAVHEYKDDPYNTTLNSLIPCEDLLSDSGVFVEVATGIRDSLSTVNTTYLQVGRQLNLTLPALCQPIGPPPSYDYSGICPNNTISIDQLPQLVEPFSCSTNDTQTCNQQGKLLTDSQYKTIVAYATGVRALLDVFPSIDALTNCSFVENAFTDLLENNCGPTKRASHLNWGASLALTVSMISLITSWLILTYPIKQRRLRKAISPWMPLRKKPSGAQSSP